MSDKPSPFVSDTQIAQYASQYVPPYGKEVRRGCNHIRDLYEAHLAEVMRERDELREMTRWIPAGSPPADWNTNRRKHLVLTVPPDEMKHLCVEGVSDTFQAWYRGPDVGWVFEFNPVHPSKPIVTHYMEIPAK